MILARDLATNVAGSQSSESLVALYGHAAEANGAQSSLRVLARDRIALPKQCYVCGAPRVEGMRFCEACGATQSVVVRGAANGMSAAARLEAVRSATSSWLTVLGEMPSSDGGSVYFAREPQPGSVLLALVPWMSGLPHEPATELMLDVMPAIDAIQPSLSTPGVEEGARAGAANDAAPRQQAGAREPAGRATPPHPATVAEDPLVGSLLDGKYRIVRLLGQGGMGRVFDARHEQLRGRRAIKVMHQHLQERPDLVTRFYEEARNAELIKHPHVCLVHDFGEANGLIYIAMEFVEGEPLSALLKREGKLSPQRVASIVAQTAEALDAAHALEIIHRDVKPDNIMLCRHADGRDDVKVVDFGISKALNRERQTGDNPSTQFGVVIGTLDYMSMEQRSGLAVDRRTDVYALGRTAVKMLCGELPEQTGWAEWSRTRVPPELIPVLGRALAPLDQRYTSAGDFSRDLRAAIGEHGVLDRITEWLQPRIAALRARPRLMWSAVGAAALLVVLAAAAPAIGRLFASKGDDVPPVAPPIAIVASPTEVRFEARDGASVPARHMIMLRDTSGTSLTGLGVASVQYDDSSAHWLGAPMVRDGSGATPASLVLEPRVGSTPAGAHTARVRILSSMSPSAEATVVATLVVPRVVTPPGPIDPGAGAPPVDPCTASRAQLARLKRLTDPEKGTLNDAHRVVALAPALVPQLCSDVERIEAQFRLAEAYMTLEQTDRACGVLRRIEAQAAATKFAASVDAFLSRCQ